MSEKGPPPASAAAPPRQPASGPAAAAAASSRSPWEGFFRLAAALSGLLPTPVAAFLARWVLGVRGVARTVVYLGAETVARLSLALPGEFLARVAVRLEPPARQQVLPMLPFEAVFQAAGPLIAAREFDITARFAELLPRNHLKQLVVQLNDMEGVAHIAGHLPPEKAAEVLMAFSPALGAQLVEAVVRQGYPELTAAVGPLVPRHRVERIASRLGQTARAALLSRLPPDEAPAG